MIAAVVLIAGVLAGVGLLVGGLLGFAVVLWAQGMASALRIISDGYYLLVGLMPLVLWLALDWTHDREGYQAAYRTPLLGILTALQGAIIGSVLGTGPIFLAAAVNLPVFLANFNLSEYGPALRDEIVWAHLSLAVVAAVISALPLGLWAHYTRAGRAND